MREEAMPYVKSKHGDKILRLQVRLPPMLFEAMKASAHRGGRTLNGEIVFQLLEVYDKQREPLNIQRLMQKTE